MQFWSLQGLQEQLNYEDVRALQLQLVELRIQDLIPDTVLFLEHKPVITRGRGLQFTGNKVRPRHMPFLHPLPSGIDFSETERGGDLTYHGPGQLVIYPICKLNGEGFAPYHDVAGFLRKFEQILIQELRSRRLDADVKEGATGVWIGDKKLASMGIAIRKWVTFHGMAINCVNDLQPFYLISPCGFQPEMMTRLADWLPLGNEWRMDLQIALMNQIAPGSQLLELSLEEALQKTKLPMST